MNPSFIDAKLLFLQTKSIMISKILIFRVLYLNLRFRLREDYFYL